jgi:16S rRNA (guanine1516-N2)-methyltransferase
MLSVKRKAEQFLRERPYSLEMVEGKLSLCAEKIKPFSIDFLAGKSDFRRRAQGQKEQIVKATLAGQNDAEILDLTAGLARDAFVMAGSGARVLLCERNPVMAALLDDAIRRLAQSPIGKKYQLTLRFVDALTESFQPSFEVVYLDPMHPPRKSTAQVKKDIAMVQDIVGSDLDKEALFAKACKLASKRVVLKWPVKVPHISKRAPDFIYQGKSTNFEVYLK